MNAIIPCATYRFIFIYAVVVCLSACGYHLSGNTAHQGRLFSPILKQVSIQGLNRYDRLRRTIKLHLISYGMQIRSPKNVDTHIVVTENKTKERGVVVGDFARTREKLLLVTLSFHVSYNGSYILQNQSIQIEGTYLYDNNDPSRNQNERDRVLGFLYQRVAEQLVDRLATTQSKARKKQKSKVTSKRKTDE